MSLVVLTPATNTPVALADAKTFLRVDYTQDDALITGLLAAATDYAERYTRRSLCYKTFRYTIDTFPYGPIEFPRQPVVPVTADGVTYTYDMPQFTYVNNTGSTAQLVLGTDYELDLGFNPPRVMLPPSHYWPLTQPAKRNAVTIDFVAGYSVDGSKVPDAIKTAIMMMAAHWYETRTSVTEAAMAEVPFSCRALLDIYKSGDYQFHQIGGYQ
jgi:uncharacterized phiE125 gp8 family phage protein